jgi:20S proteasome subunit beta 7
VGTSLQDETLATGYGAYIARPLLRKAYRCASANLGKHGLNYPFRPDLSEEEAKQILDDCMRVLFYRDARTINKIQVAKATAEGLSISEPYELATEWTHCEKAMGYPIPEL